MKFKRIILLLCSLIILPGLQAQRDFSESAVTKLVLLGTGNPNPSPEHSGCALALVVKSTHFYDVPQHSETESAPVSKPINRFEINRVYQPGNPL